MLNGKSWANSSGIVRMTWGWEANTKTIGLLVSGCTPPALRLGTIGDQGLLRHGRLSKSFTPEICGPECGFSKKGLVLLRHCSSVGKEVF